MSIFGYELSYHTLEYYTNDKDDTTQVIVIQDISTKHNNQVIRVYLGSDKVMEEVFSRDDSRNMFIMLEQYEGEQRSEMEDDEETDEDE